MPPLRALCPALILLAACDSGSATPADPAPQHAQAPAQAPLPDDPPAASEDAPADDAASPPQDAGPEPLEPIEPGTQLTEDLYCQAFAQLVCSGLADDCTARTTPLLNRATPSVLVCGAAGSDLGELIVLFPPDEDPKGWTTARDIVLHDFVATALPPSARPQFWVAVGLPPIEGKALVTDYGLPAVKKRLADNGFDGEPSR